MPLATHTAVSSFASSVDVSLTLEAFSPFLLLRFVCASSLRLVVRHCAVLSLSRGTKQYFILHIHVFVLKPNYPMEKVTGRLQRLLSKDLRGGFTRSHCRILDLPIFTLRDSPGSIFASRLHLESADFS